MVGSITMRRGVVDNDRGLDASDFGDELLGVGKGHGRKAEL